MDSRKVKNMRKINLLLIMIIVAFLGSCQTQNKDGTVGARQAPVKLIRVETPGKPDSQLERIVSVFIRQVEKRCSAKVTTQGEAPLTVVLTIDSSIGDEGFRIRDHADGGIEVAGQNELGILYGLGKLLRASQYLEEGFIAGSWRGESVPKKPVRGIYFATHFHNFYHDGPVTEIQRYVEELALWGCNNLMVWYDMNHFNGFDDPKAVAFRERLDGILKTASGLGLGTAFIMIGNEGYSSSPKELRSTGGKRGGYYESQICPNKPGGMDYELRVQTEMMDWMRSYNPQYLCLWPFDPGGCDCEYCRPWATNGFVEVAKSITKAARDKLPDVKIVLSNWFYNESEKTELGKILSAEPLWVDLVLGPVPGTDIPAVNFPEISMLNVKPWGGYGATPVPQQLQSKYSQMANINGGWSYSEGIFEDMNKVTMLQMYWNPENSDSLSLREYATFEFSPEVADDVLTIIKILESNFQRNAITASAIDAYELAQKVDAQLSPEIQKSWRWRILFLRTLIDKEMHLTKGALKGEVLKDAFAELTRIYHADNALDGWLRPPKVTLDGFEAEKVPSNMDLDPENR
jgi:hypothetical protein